MKVELTKLLRLRLNEDISCFDTTDRTYRVTVEALMSLNDIASAADTMQNLCVLSTDGMDIVEDKAND